MVPERSEMPRKRKSRQDIIKAKIGNMQGGGMNYEPPTARLGLVKNGDEEDVDEVIEERLLRSFVAEAIRCL